VQTASQERDENAGFDPVLQLVMDGMQHQISFEVFEGRFHLGQLNIIEYKTATIQPRCGRR